MLVAAWYVVQIYHFLFKMKTPWSAMHWYGIVWYYMVRYGLLWHPSSTFSFKSKDLVVCTHWNFLSNPTDPTKLTHGKGRPRAISCAGQSCQRRKVQTYVVISPLGDAWIFLKLFTRVLSIIWLDLLFAVLRITGLDLLFANKRRNCQTANDTQTDDHTKVYR